MKKNQTMRVGVLLLALTLITTCFVGGTLAKYTTSATSNDSARVAYWGFQSTNTMNLTGLFSKTYDNVEGSADVIAPGTSRSTTFAFAYDETNATAPEVAYDFKVEVTASCDDSIKNNANIQWKLDEGAWGTFDAMVDDVKALSGDDTGTKRYAAGELPEAFGTDDAEHTISWQWIFETTTGEGQPGTQDAADTAMGNAADLADCSIEIKISATQVD